MCGDDVSFLTTATTCMLAAFAQIESLANRTNASEPLLLCGRRKL